MKQEQLLEAIGGVDENMLMETERLASHPPKQLGRVILVAALIPLLAIIAVGTKINWQLQFGQYETTDVYNLIEIIGMVETADGGYNQSNIATGSGKFLWHDNCLYYGTDDGILKLNLQTGKIDMLPLESDYDNAIYLFATKDYLGYVGANNKLVVMRQDGTDHQVVMQEKWLSNAYIDGTKLYTNNGSAFDYIDLENGKRQLILSNIHDYDVGNRFLYVLPNDEGNVFLRSEKNEIRFERFELSFFPSALYADGEDLYFSDSLKGNIGGEKRYQIVHYSNGVETRLPIYSLFVQRVGDCLVYLDDTEENRVVKSYNLTTGVITVLQENASEFSVLKGRYVVFHLVNNGFVIYDWETGECQIYKEYYSTGYWYRVNQK